MWRRGSKAKEVILTMIAERGCQNHLPRKRFCFTVSTKRLRWCKYGTKQLREWMPLEPQPLEEEVMIMRRLFVLET